MSRELFGQIALRNGLLTRAQLERGLHAQAVLRDLGMVKKIGEVLREMGLLHQGQVRSVLNAQGEDVGPHQIGSFEILSKIGRGAMGSVFKARQISMDRIVALKVLSPHLAEDPLVVERIRHEAMLTGKLNHPHIVQGIEMGEADGYYYFAMEYVEGETLHKVIVREGWLPEAEAVRITAQIASALEHAHKFGIVHRDIKPGNIMITDTGMAKLCDLGLARWGGPEERYPSEAGTAVGTPYYISPEQVEGRPDVDIRSDLYSLGATLYRAVVGEVPFDGATPAIIMDKHLTQELPSPKALNPILSDGLCRIIAKMMVKDRAQRYQTPTEARRDLEALAQGQPIFWARPHSLKPRGFLSAGEPEPSAPAVEAAESRRGELRNLAELHAHFVELYPDPATRFQRVLKVTHYGADESKPQAHLKCGLLLLAEKRYREARVEFSLAARHGAPLAQVIAKLDALDASPGMVYVPAGDFLMGSDEHPDERPRRIVHLPAFFMDENPVTNGQYMRFVKATGHRAPPHWKDGAPTKAERDLPVTHVSFEDAQAYALWAGKRLPTESEWEKAARGADGRIWPWGNAFSASRCPCAEAHATGPCPVGKYLGGKSPFGCYDMAGNVAEWTTDTYQPRDRGGSAQAERNTGEPMRVIRGGSWAEPGVRVRCAARAGLPPDSLSPKCGFRCAKDCVPTPAHET